MKATLILVAVGLLGRPSTVQSTGQASELDLTPARPRAGDTLGAVYRPTTSLFPHADSLLLRARLRTSVDGMYADQLPVQQLRVLATLHRRANGAYEGTFVFPDSFVFASLAVQDVAASRVDDNAGRLWEVLAYARDGRPTFEALQQRLNDMMGRSWEEGYATARRLSDLYPDRIESWALREFFERELVGEAGADSVAAAYKPRVDSLVRAAKERPALAYGEIGTIFFRAWRNPRRSSADSVEFEYWWKRISIEYPRHELVAQRLAFDLNSYFRETPRALLDTLERLYPQLIPIRGPGKLLFNAALQAADQAHDDSAYRLWFGRSLRGDADSALQTALALSAQPAFRNGAMRVLRAQLEPTALDEAVTRRLTETAADRQRDVERLRRQTLAALGRALIAEGNTRAGLDTLNLAARGAWDVTLFRDLAAAYLTAGDTVAADVVNARVAVDPRTAPATVDSLARGARARLGMRWDSATTAAHREMQISYLKHSVIRPLRGTPRLRDSRGRTHTLQELAGGRPSVVIFWSRNCGAARQALPSITDAVRRLRSDGTPVVMVVDEAPSPELSGYLAKRHFTWSIYDDVAGTTATAFGNFGTPSYYVVDGRGRIRFSSLQDEAELLTQVDALRNERQ